MALTRTIELSGAYHPLETERYLDDADIKRHLKYTRDWDRAARFVRTKKRLPQGLLAFATAPLHKAPFIPDVVYIESIKRRWMARKRSAAVNC